MWHYRDWWVDNDLYLRISIFWNGNNSSIISRVTKGIVVKKFKTIVVIELPTEFQYVWNKWALSPSGSGVLSGPILLRVFHISWSEIFCVSEFHWSFLIFGFFGGLILMVLELVDHLEDQMCRRKPDWKKGNQILSL